MKEAKKESIVVPAIEQIVTLIHKSTSDNHCVCGVLKAAIGLLGIDVVYFFLISFFIVLLVAQYIDVILIVKVKLHTIIWTDY